VLSDHVRWSKGDRAEYMPKWRGPCGGAALAHTVHPCGVPEVGLHLLMTWVIGVFGPWGHDRALCRCVCRI
jgi:hypothetical protein